MVYGFAKQSDGHVKIYSEVGQGTSVKIYLPRGSGKWAQASDALAVVPIKGGSETILMVEDDDGVRTYVESQLLALGYNVLTANNGMLALDLVRQHPEIELLFTDVIMPGGMNGRQLADAARQIRPALGVLYTSGYSKDAIMHQGRLDPGINLLSKPYLRSELARMIRIALDSGPAGAS
jgi:CheY-like chemotaxis protein